jgi:hypothetical protein
MKKILVHYCPTQEELNRASKEIIRAIVNFRPGFGHESPDPQKDKTVPPGVLALNDNEEAVLIWYNYDEDIWTTQFQMSLNYCPNCGVRLTKDAFTEI